MMLFRLLSDKMKLFYYRGLNEFKRNVAYLRDTCLSAQDTYKAWVGYFYPEIDLENENVTFSKTIDTTS